MTTPLWAGFESAFLHWNRHCVLSATGHVPGERMARHYEHALAMGAEGFRDCLPERMDPVARLETARAVVGDTCPIVWSLTHWDSPRDWKAHAQRVARLLGPADRLLAVVEPSVGEALSRRSVAAATAMSAAIMSAALDANPDVRFWTCDPVHDHHDLHMDATGALVDLFGEHVEAVGMNYHSLYGAAPLFAMLQEVQARFPGHRVALTETSWHEGHPDARRFFPWVHDRAGWWAHVQGEADKSGVNPVAACWYPFIDMAFEPGQVWPNGWHQQP